MTEHPPTGIHILVDGKGADYDKLNNADFLLAILKEGASIARATVLHEYVKEFEPCGITVALILAESHFTIHTYPNEGIFMADFFTCGDTCDPKLAVNYLLKYVKTTSNNIYAKKRGL